MVKGHFLNLINLFIAGLDLFSWYYAIISTAIIIIHFGLFPLKNRNVKVCTKPNADLEFLNLKRSAWNGNISIIKEKFYNKTDYRISFQTVKFKKSIEHKAGRRFCGVQLEIKR